MPQWCVKQKHVERSNRRAVPLSLQPTFTHRPTIISSKNLNRFSLFVSPECVLPLECRKHFDDDTGRAEQMRLVIAQLSIFSKTGSADTVGLTEVAKDSR